MDHSGFSLSSSKVVSHTVGQAERLHQPLLLSGREADIAYSPDKIRLVFRSVSKGKQALKAGEETAK